LNGAVAAQVPIAEELFDVKSINTDLPSILLGTNKNEDVNIW
jgi:hypothetical protein